MPDRSGWRLQRAKTEHDGYMLREVRLLLGFGGLGCLQRHVRRQHLDEGPDLPEWGALGLPRGRAPGEPAVLCDWRLLVVGLVLGKLH